MPEVSAGDVAARLRESIERQHRVKEAAKEAAKPATPPPPAKGPGK